MITPTTIDLTIYQGATFRRSWALTSESDGSPYNLTAWTARMQIREKKTSETVLLELTTENGGIIIEVTPEESKYTIYISADQTAAFTGKGVYDLELVDPQGEVIRIQEGKVSLSTEVTRPVVDIVTP